LCTYNFVRQCLTNSNSWFNFDVVGLLCFGKEFGFIEQETDVRGLIRKFTETIWLGEFLGELDNFSWLVRDTAIGKYLLQPSPTDTKGIGAVMGERDRILEEMLDEDGEAKVPLPENTFLHKFLNTRNEDGPPMSMKDVKAEILLALLVSPNHLHTYIYHAFLLTWIGCHTTQAGRVRERLSQSSSSRLEHLAQSRGPEEASART
jgi:hypothetical protein